MVDYDKQEEQFGIWESMGQEIKIVNRMADLREAGEPVIGESIKFEENSHEIKFFKLISLLVKGGDNMDELNNIKDPLNNYYEHLKMELQKDGDKKEGLHPSDKEHMTQVIKSLNNLIAMVDEM